MRHITKTLLLLTVGMILSLPSCSDSGTYSGTNSNCGSGSSQTTTTYVPSTNGGGTSTDSGSTSEDTSVSEGHSDTSEEAEEETSTSTPETVVNEPSGHTFADFEDAIDSSKPTKITTIVSYYLPSDKITLNFQSTMTIEYGSEVKAVYQYSYDKLNPIGSKEFMSTISGTAYYSGDLVGLQNGDSIKWTTNVEGSTSFLLINFVKSYFSSFDIDENNFSGNVYDSKVSLFFSKNYGITNLNVDLVANKDFDNISRMNLVYTSRDGAEVHSNCRYSYNYEKVDF